MDVIFLEPIGKIGHVGHVTSVKGGYGRYLIRYNKALAATRKNKELFKAQQEIWEKKNQERKHACEKKCEEINNLRFIIVRQASEAGALYGSVRARDVIEALAKSGHTGIAASQIKLGVVKDLGLHEAKILLHPEVEASVILNVARSEEEASLQEKRLKPTSTKDENQLHNAVDVSSEEPFDGDAQSSAAPSLDKTEGTQESDYENNIT